MSLIYKQVSTSSLCPAKGNELEGKNINLNPVFKHLLNCKSCLWKITFYESAGPSILIHNKKMRCPVCKERVMNYTKIRIIS
jgi:hypothetical protein